MSTIDAPREASPQDLRHLRCALMAWYDEHRRDLPWRRDANPYRVWVSEIMLQQTRVAAVLEHYVRFMARFPTVQALAAAREQSVLAVWSGLGYYHRARRMHQAAKIIANERDGEFPTSAETWIELPGIGRYTAAAIASIAFHEPVAVVDGNVERVLSRVSGGSAGKAEAWVQAQSWLTTDRPGDFNQAMMELGAILCTPRTPQCLLCPVKPWCRTRGELAQVPRAPRKRKQLSYGLARQGDAVLLMQRSRDMRLMAGMWELPQVDGDLCNPPTPLATFKHSITDTDYQVLVFDASELALAEARWCTRKQWERMALTGLTRKILKKLAPPRS